MIRMEKKLKKIYGELIDIEDRLKQIAQEMGQTNFANQVGITKADVSNWLAGRKQFSYKKLLKIANNLLEV